MNNTPTTAPEGSGEPRRPALLQLASQSPRRAEFLRLLGVGFEVLRLSVDETRAPQEPPAAYVERVAVLKVAAARAVLGAGHAVLAADTTVSVDGEVFGKPRDRAAAATMLAALSGRWHEVLSAVALGEVNGTIRSVVVTTRVEFCTLAPTLIAAYLDSGEGDDKAGAYGIQGLGGALVTRIDGSYSNVVGLPLAETRALLDRAGITHRLAARA